MENLKRSFAFTLAEVLIVLAILGVISAMTIPSLIQNTKGKEYKTKLKKTVSVLNQAVLRNVALENEGFTLENVSVATGFDSNLNYIANSNNIFLKTLKDAQLENIKTGCGKGAHIVTADGVALTMSYFSGSATLNCEKTVRINIDVNGTAGPNKLTKDANDPQDTYQLGACIGSDVVSCDTSDSTANAACKKILKE